MMRIFLPSLCCVCFGLLWPVWLRAQTLQLRDMTTLEPLEQVRMVCRSDTLVSNARGEIPWSPALARRCDSLRFFHVNYQPQALTPADIMARDYHIYLEPRVLTFEEVVVSAHRWEQDRDRLPVQIAALQSRTLDLQQPANTADALALTGQVLVQKSQQGGGSPMIRGFAANRILLVLDGVRINTAIFRSGNLHNVMLIDPLMLRSAEVLFGPGTVLYGSDALGGVLDFHSREPRFTVRGTQVEGRGLIQYRTAERSLTSHAEVRIQGKRLTSQTHFTWRDFGDLRMGRYGHEDYRRLWYVERRQGRDVRLPNPDPEVQRFSGFRQYHLGQQLGWRVHDRWELRYGMYTTWTSDVPRYDRLMQEAGNGQPEYAEWYYGPHIWSLHRIGASHRPASGWADTMRIQLAFQHYEESRHDRRWQQTRLRSRTEQVAAYSLNLDVGKQLHPDWELFWGSELVWNEVGSRGNARNLETGQMAPVSTRYPDGSYWYAGAVYGSLQWQPLPSLTVTGGLRGNLVGLHADFDRTFFPFPFEEVAQEHLALNGSLGAVWQPHPHWDVSLNLASGFRAPNIDDIGKVFDSEPGRLVVPNPDLGPEKAWNIEPRLTFRPSERLRFEAAVFGTYLQDAMVRAPFAYAEEDSLVYDGERSQVLAEQNLGFARIAGIQFAAQAALAPAWVARLQYTATWGEDSDGNPLRHAGPMQGRAELAYQRRGLQAVLSALWNGEVAPERMPPSERSKTHMYAADTRGNPYSPAWLRVDLKAQYALSPTLRLGAGIENLFDQRYRPFSSGIVAPGRNFLLTLEARF